MTVGSFSDESLELAFDLIFAQGQNNPLAGQCGQKEKRERMQKPRTPAQEAADTARSTALTGKSRTGTNRSEAAKKAAQTRKRCKGASSQPPNSTTV